MYPKSRHESFPRRNVSNNSEIGIEQLRTFHCHRRKFYRAYKTTLEGEQASRLELRLAVFIGAILSDCLSFFKPAISLMTNSLTFSRQLYIRNKKGRLLVITVLPHILSLSTLQILLTVLERRRCFLSCCYFEMCSGISSRFSTLETYNIESVENDKQLSMWQNKHNTTW